MDIQSLLENVSPQQREKAEAFIQEHPEAVDALRQDLEAELAQGKNQMMALLAVAQKHKETLSRLMQ